MTIGSKTYEFKNALTSPVPVDGQVLIAAGGDSAATLKNLANALLGAAHQTLLNLKSAVNGDGSSVCVEGSGTPNNSIGIERVEGNVVHLKSRHHTLLGNSESVAATAPLTAGGAFMEGASPLTLITVTAKQGGTGPNTIQLDKSTNLPANWLPDPAFPAVPAETLHGGITYTAPAFVVDWPLIGIHAQGDHLSINNVHIEGVGIGVNVLQSDSTGSVTISNVDAWLMNDADQAFTKDTGGANITSPALARQAATYPAYGTTDFPHYWKYSCAVLISRNPGEYLDHKNDPDRVTLINVRSIGGCKYVLRDARYGIEHSAFGHGYSPNLSTGVIAFYVRGDSFAPSAGIAPNTDTTANYGSTDFGDTNSTKIFFIGPVG